MQTSGNRNYILIPDLGMIGLGAMKLDFLRSYEKWIRLNHY